MKKITVAQLTKALQENDETLESVLARTNDGEVDYAVQCAIENLINVTIFDLQSGTNDAYYIQAEYYHDDTKLNIVLKADVYLGETLEEYVEAINHLQDEKQKVDELLKGVK